MKRKRRGAGERKSSSAAKRRGVGQGRRRKPRPFRSSAPRLIQLRWLAHARSGDKGNTANVGLIALEPELYPLLAREVTAARVRRHFRGMVSGVKRFELPNLGALNFLLHDALDGGGTISLKTDAQGKVYSTALLRMEIPVPAHIARRFRGARG
ncbi:MAG: AtuA-related protein [Gemmatimonadales bacterium]